MELGQFRTHYSASQAETKSGQFVVDDALSFSQRSGGRSGRRTAETLEIVQIKQLDGRRPANRGLDVTWYPEVDHQEIAIPPASGDVGKLGTGHHWVGSGSRD